VDIKLKGKLNKVNCVTGKCGWKFTGEATALPNYFDFNQGEFNDDGKSERSKSMIFWDQVQYWSSKKFYMKFDGLVNLTCAGLCPE